ncbi:SDR family NAD(P)-dependent oxidoreductase [Aureimonas phyllosphaerae]|uniref:NAD(P)-dependent dehydrogenase (Short-subunit alcohol dehydrogenase family) n=1 Tax=Aureimonas phyllosphaerae TaxID=1166078 RepID=A0A7W6BVQ1_9HYPH|nr:SDR family oxidoreductase [Aureimonas phyllosphaerae]MBB3935590.1 NAD(P)-dependent dehydrogenase (short-subunit alcohol dehydrogenase family) [Aureimonas phyllosphaerae]MBB3959598.1 NAD(P)-dependent dehydrogenase (short-subunit alcohol dehydrogenase family) [Aureimonas phyllosphaerae]SFF12690.1 3-oxoacyl-[acyl-carrier protein] reductase [Aureimonas phyllosphaerae]
MTGFDEKLFAGRTVMVTGAGRGIGAAVATAFLRCGAKVIAHAGRDLSHVEGDLLARLPAGSRANLTLLTGDLAAPDGGAELAREILSHADAIDVLVNNAGTMGGRIPTGQETREDYDHVLDLNIRSVVALTGTLLPALRRANHASIVNTVSISGRQGGSAGSALYSGAKAFVSAWTKTLAKELAPDGIRVNAVSPGTIMTDFHRRYSTKEKLDATAATIPMKRLGTAEDCAPAYLFLAAHTLSGYVTGQILEVNGGQLMP